MTGMWTMAIDGYEAQLQADSEGGWVGIVHGVLSDVDEIEIRGRNSEELEADFRQKLVLHTAGADSY